MQQLLQARDLLGHAGSPPHPHWPRSGGVAWRIPRAGDYLIPTMTDFPKIRAIALENHRSPSNPLGVKGAGEGAIIPIGGLMANAVANALASFGATSCHSRPPASGTWVRPYDRIARNRYRLFGRNESCLVPTSAIPARFVLDDPSGEKP
jgi:hypothetical protein